MDFRRFQENITKAYEIDKGSNLEILHNMAVAEEGVGNHAKAVDLCAKAIKAEGQLPGYVHPRIWLILIHLRNGNLLEAQRVFEDSRSRYVFSEKEWWVERRLKWVEALLLDANGRHSEADEKWSRVLEMAKRPGADTVLVMVQIKSTYIQRCLQQGRFSTAEIESRDLIGYLITQTGKDSGHIPYGLITLSDVLLAQGRSAEAEQVVKRALQIRENLGIAPYDADSALFYERLIDIACIRHDYAGAVRYYDDATSNFKNNPYVIRQYFSSNRNIIHALIKTGRAREALEIIDLISGTEDTFGGDPVELLLLRGMAHFQQADVDSALRFYKLSADRMPDLKNQFSRNFLKKQLFRSVLESYLEFFADIHGKDTERRLGVDASLEAFKLTEYIRRQEVPYSLAASSARIAAGEAGLAEIVRQAQDLQQQIEVVERMLMNHASLPPGQQDPRNVNDLQNKLSVLGNARDVLLDDIRRKFPEYFDLINPRPADYASVAGMLKPHEALVSIYTSESSAYIWAVPPSGKADFHVVPLTSSTLSSKVAELRRALDLQASLLNDIPPFDLELSHWLYRDLLAPVANIWSDKRALLIIADGPLGPLPFSVLTTSPYASNDGDGELFGGFRNAPWLVKKMSLTRLPSVSAFLSLRKLPAGDPTRKALAGFGDPIFNAGQRDDPASGERQKTLSRRDGVIRTRGVRITSLGPLENSNLASSRLGMLDRLADTAEELISVAQSLGADANQNVFLQEKASEQQVKSIDLSNRKVVYFATHALLPGDLDGLTEPALALSAPEIVGGDNDGLLTAGEIMMLRLDADWVVLSACNTGAGNGAGAEAVSGLGRAFFYAGTRAVLVSMWPVESSSAKQLTTRLFELLEGDPRLSKAEALRRSMLDLMRGPGLVDELSGKTAASYAHPFFWAPFVIVGESENAY